MLAFEACYADVFKISETGDDVNFCRNYDLVSHIDLARIFNMGRVTSRWGLIWRMA
jgi:hypothetical protein